MTAVRTAVEAIALLTSLGLFSHLVLGRPPLPSATTVASRETGRSAPPVRPPRIPASNGREPGPPGPRCPHPETGWKAASGVMTCSGCGTRRIIDYRGLGPAIEPPERAGPFGPTNTGIGTLEDNRLIAAGERGQSREDLLKKVREANRRSGEVL